MAATIQATPAVALGAYEMTPLEVAAGYTAFANGGVRAEPMFLHSVVNNDGKVLEDDQPRTHQVLDPRVAYLVTNVMEDVINHGTAYPVRARGFTAPAAGKTGSSRDGWFAGYTSNLLCVVWVGFDDNRDLGLAGGASAAPIWAEFMKRAVTASRVQKHAELLRPQRRGHRQHRSGNAAIGHAELSRNAPGSFHRRYAADGLLRKAQR